MTSNKFYQCHVKIVTLFSSREQKFQILRRHKLAAGKMSPLILILAHQVFLKRICEEQKANDTEMFAVFRLKTYVCFLHAPNRYTIRPGQARPMFYC